MRCRCKGIILHKRGQQQHQFYINLKLGVFNKNRVKKLTILQCKISEFFFSISIYDTIEHPAYLYIVVTHARAYLLREIIQAFIHVCTFSSFRANIDNQKVSAYMKQRFFCVGSYFTGYFWNCWLTNNDKNERRVETSIEYFVLSTCKVFLHWMM